MKKGISLIVLVITIIVMIIIAGAIIISLNSTSIMTRSDEAVVASDLANLKSELTLKYAETMIANEKADNDDDPATVSMTSDELEDEYEDILEKYDRLEDAGYGVKVKSATDLSYVVTLTVGSTTTEV